MKEQSGALNHAGLARLGHLVSTASANLLDFILPPRCASCGERTDRDVGLCATCWPNLSFITDPYCQHCGVPFEFSIPGTSKCAVCLRRPPAFDKAFSPLVYEGASRDLVLQFKHGDRLGHAALLAQLMAPHVASFGYESPIMLPVPLHPMRIMRRRFNQSALIAKALGKRLDLPVDVLALKRTRATPMQQGLNASQRRRNVRGAFAVDRARAKRIQGHDIMLIDDVYTTGATAEACARALRKAGAGRIGVLTATRVVGPEAAIL